MSSPFEKWAADHERFKSVRDGFLPRILQWHTAADETSRLMLNVLFLLHGGGLVALPTLKAIFPAATFSDASLAWSGSMFVIGLALALFCGVLTIWNYRSLASGLELQMNAALKRANEEANAKLWTAPLNRYQVD